MRIRLQRLLHPYSKKSKEANRKAQLKERGPVGSAPASSATASSSAAGGEAFPFSLPFPSHVPLSSYLRPCNIIGGGFVCTKAGFIPRFVVAYWERHCRAAS